MQGVDVWLLLPHFGLAVILAEFDCLMPFTHVVVKGANVQLVASVLVTHDSLVFVWMVKSFNSCMTFSALESFGALIPANAVNESFAVLWCILENVRRSSEVSCVVREIATF